MVKWTRSKRPTVFPIVALVLGVGLAVILIAGSARATPKRLRPGRIDPAIVAIAKKWATKRGLPTSWVLATIWAESNGDPSRIGDNGISYGLMQINTRAHGSRLAAAGVTAQMLLDPDKNIEWGTLILREAADKAKREGASPLDVATRHVYVGHGPTARVPQVVANWDEALVRTQELV